MSEELSSAIKKLAAAFTQQQRRWPRRDNDTIAVYYGDLRRLVEASNAKSDK